MKMKLSILLVVALLVIVGVGIYFWLSTQEPGVGPQTPSDPFGSLIGQEPTPTGALPLALEDGTVVSVPDFTKENQPEWASESAGYQVAGGTEDRFLITYIMPDAYGSQAQFLIALLEEPLGENRLAAEAALKVRLGLSEEELCALDAQVWTMPDVNSAYAGRDLGLSFCPDATRLP